MTASSSRSHEIIQPAAAPLNRRLVLIGVGGLALLITVGHYVTPSELEAAHGLLRRLYYLPIIMAAVAWGAPGGVLAALLCSLLYSPHAFLIGPLASHEGAAGIAYDPSATSEKTLEVLVFFGVGGVTGLLSQRLTGALGRAEALSEQLRHALAARENMQEQLVRTEKLAALGKLSAGLAHEIRNPLGSIRGAAEVLAEDYAQGHRKHGLASILLKELDRLDGVLTSFLQFARPPTPDPSQIVVDEIVTDVVRLASANVRLTNIQVEVDKAATAVTCWADANQVRQVLINLVINSIDAMGGEGSLTLRIGETEENGTPYGTIEVADSGPGVASNLGVTIFEPFCTTKDTGTGLGLAVSHSLAEANHGHLRLVESAHGGATFVLLLPSSEEATHDA